MEKRSFYGLLLLILLMAFIDTIGVVSILPFITVLMNPDIIRENGWLEAIFLISSNFGVDGYKPFLFFLGVLVFIALVVSILFKAFVTYRVLKFTHYLEYKISCEVMQSYIYRDYKWHLEKNSAEMGKTILSEVSLVVSNALVPFVTIVAQGAVALALLIMVVAIEPAISLFGAAGLIIMYGLIFRLVNNAIDSQGRLRLKANADRFHSVSESFGAIKEIKAAGLEYKYVEKFSRPAALNSKFQANAQSLAQLPRFGLEIIAFGGMQLVLLYLVGRDGSMSGAIPVVALFAFTAYRLMPALQQIYASVMQLRFIGPSLDVVVGDLREKTFCAFNGSAEREETLAGSIEIVDLFFNYDPKRPILKNINLVIPPGTIVGFVGPTGSGKSSLIDLILGLHTPDKGCIRIGGNILSPETKLGWGSCVGYVSQSIYLSDGSLASNIAFGYDQTEIDMGLVVEAAKQACIHDFIVNELPLGYETSVGERGVKLSGGQRQRLGIARALYRQPLVLIMDEATNALDTVTENLVMDSIYGLRPSVTVILIAHRLSTLKNCDAIYVLEDGCLTGQGRYEELLDANPMFRTMHTCSQIDNIYTQ